ncbi:MAG: hypothetical protein N2999_00165 [Proteobacteria bacterium]|nr:hypothetical protein [Pseudomonadota bacterium]
MIKIAGIQFHSKKDVGENLSKSKSFMDIAVDEGAKIIAFPELFLTEWFPAEMREEYFKLAESYKGESVKFYRDYSKKNKVILIVPFFEKYGRSFYNSTAVIEKGRIIGIYRKVHIPQIPLWEEKYYFRSGDSLPVFNTSICKIGIQICWDNFFFEGYRCLALNGAELVVTPTASAMNTQNRWRIVISTQALLNNIFIFRVNRVGKERYQEFYGNSFLAGPDGLIVGKPAGELEGVYITELNLNIIKRAKKYFPFLKDRKPKLYSRITEDLNE